MVLTIIFFSLLVVGYIIFVLLLQAQHRKNEKELRDSTFRYEVELSQHQVTRDVASYYKALCEQSDRQHKILLEEIVTLTGEMEKWKENAGKELSSRKSSEVRTGKIAENFATLMDRFPYPLEDATFLGQPIDFICWGEDAVHIVEVKSGNAQLSKKQRMIRDLIKEGKVTFETFRIKDVEE